MGEQFHYLFEPIMIGTAKLRNRIVSTAHSTRFGEDGMIGDRFCAYHEARAKGGVGLIITEAQPVHPSSIPRPGMIHNWEDRVIPGFRNLARVVHKHGTKSFRANFPSGQTDEFIPYATTYPCPLPHSLSVEA